MGQHLWCAGCGYAYSRAKGTMPNCPVCGSYQLEEYRSHEPETLDKIAFLHGETAIDGLTAEGVQARAWYVVSRLPDVEPPEYAGIDTQQSLAAIIGFYAAVFEVDPAAVARDIAARYGQTI